MQTLHCLIKTHEILSQRSSLILPVRVYVEMIMHLFQTSSWTNCSLGKARESHAV